MGVFKVFSKPRLTIWFDLLEKEDIIILNMCAKLQVQVIFRSRYRGSKGVKIGQKWGFRGFLKNQQADLVPSPRERRYCNSTYVCQVTGPGPFSFPRQRFKWGSKWVKNWFFVVFSKTVEPLWFHLIAKEDIKILHMFAKLQVQAIFRSRDRGSNVGQKSNNTSQTAIEFQEFRV